MFEFSFSNSCCKNNKNESSSSLLYHLFNVFFFIFLSPFLPRLLSFFSPLFLSTLSLLALSPPNLVHDNDDDDSETSDSKLGFLLSLVRKLSSKNDENDEGIRCFEEFQAYLDVFRAPICEVLEENCSESRCSGDEGRASRAHVDPTEKEPNVSFDENPFEEDGKVEAAKPVAEENMFCEKECNEVPEENCSESGYPGDDGTESSDHVGPMEKRSNVNFDENPFEEDNDKVEAAGPIAEENMFCEKESREVFEGNYSESESSGDEGRGHVGLTEDPNVNSEENPVGEDDDVDKVEKNTKLVDKFCQKRDKEVKPLGTHSKKAEESKEKMALRSGSKVKSNNSRTDAKDGTANSEEEEEEEYFGTPERNWAYIRSYGSMRKEKEWRRTLACKLYEERNNVDDGSEAMDLLWETYNDTEPDKAKGSTKVADNDEDEDEDDEEEEQEGDKGKSMKGKYCCLQALKFSAGKMNLGMRKPSLVKISKALKSIGLLHHVSSKHGRKKLH